MKKQRMQKSGCSMLAAALVGLLPIAAINAQETGRTFGQEESGTMSQELREMDEVQPQGPEDTGAQGTLREGDDSDPTLRSDERLGAEGPLRDDTEFDTDADTGAQGPMRDDTEFDADTGAEGSLRPDTELDSEMGAEGPPGSSEMDEDMDTGDAFDTDVDEGAQGPSRFDTEMDETMGAEGPRRDADIFEEGSSGSTGDRARQWQDEDTVQRQRPDDTGVRGPLRQDAEPADPNLLDESPALRSDRMERDFDATAPGAAAGAGAGAAAGAQGRLREDSSDVVHPDASGARGPLREEPAGVHDEPAIEGSMQKDLAEPKGQAGPKAADTGVVQAPARTYAYVPGALAATHYRMYLGEANEFIDPGMVYLLPYAPTGAMGPSRTEMPQYFRSYIFEANEYMDPGKVELVPMAELGARGPLREPDQWTHHFHQYNGESNPLIDQSWGYFGNSELPSDWDTTAR